MTDLPHFAFPFARTAVVEQDSSEHVMACENVIVRCPVGFRLDRPEFGWAFPEFRQRVNVDELQAALRRWEPRSAAVATELENLADAAVREITVEVES